MANLDINISVIITTYNIERYICEAIDSVLDQSFKPYEIIVIDDGSTDETHAAVEKFLPNIQYYFQKNSGTSRARNEGIKRASGNFIAFLDGDDIWLKDKLSKQVDSFLSVPDYDLVFTNAQNFYSPELDTAPKKNAIKAEKSLIGCIPSTLMIKRTSLLRVGLFPAEKRVGDYIWWYTKVRECKLKEYVVPDILVKRRIHKTNKSIKYSRNKNKELLNALRKNIKRAREKRNI